MGTSNCENRVRGRDVTFLVSYGERSMTSLLLGDIFDSVASAESWFVVEVTELSCCEVVRVVSPKTSL